MLMPYRFPTWANGTADAGGAEATPTRRSSFAATTDRDDQGGLGALLRSGRDPGGLLAPSRRALEYRLLPDDPYGPDGRLGDASSTFLYGRYHTASVRGGRWVDGFELVNEPNLQLWPQNAAAADAPDPFVKTARTIEPRSRSCSRPPRASPRSYGHSTMLYAPSISDSDTATSRLYTRYDEFVPACWPRSRRSATRRTPKQAWSHHNYTDVEKRQTATRTQIIRAQLAGALGRATPTGQAPTVFITEGGARLSRMPELYPAEDPREAQAKCLRDAWALHQTDTGAGAGVAMFAQYLLYADPNFDCGLHRPVPVHGETPGLRGLEGVPRVQVSY